MLANANANVNALANDIIITRLASRFTHRIRTTEGLCAKLRTIDPLGIRNKDNWNDKHNKIVEEKWPIHKSS